MSSPLSIPAPACYPPARRPPGIAVLTGASASPAESGVPTFRGSPDRAVGALQPEELAHAGRLPRNPNAWSGMYAWRPGAGAAAAPNLGHVALVEMERPDRRVTLITQNVDACTDGRQPSGAGTATATCFRQVARRGPAGGKLAGQRGDSAALPALWRRCCDRMWSGSGKCLAGGRTAGGGNNAPRPPRSSSAIGTLAWSIPPPSCHPPRSGPGRWWWKSIPSRLRSVPKSASV